MNDIRNIGIFAHVDAGKTTLSEQLLVHAGAIRTQGSVDSGTAHTDTLPVERRRGISVKATCVPFRHRGVQINLIDTPGHVDFSVEVERSLWALDAAILVVCAVEGVQPQTEVLFSVMREQKIPVLFFINKIDRVGADPHAVLGQIQRLLSQRAVDPEDTEAVTELVCDADDTLFEQYLGGETLPDALLKGKLAELARQGLAYPVLRGSALKDMGVEPVLDAIVDCFPAPAASEVLSGVVFAAKQEQALGRGVWVRLYGGSLETRASVTLESGIDPITGEEFTRQQKVTQIQDALGNPIGKLLSGQIGVVYGLGEIPIGHVLGAPEHLPRAVEPGSLRTPLIAVQAIPEKPEDIVSVLSRPFRNREIRPFSIHFANVLAPLIADGWALNPPLPFWEKLL